MFWPYIQHIFERYFCFECESSWLTYLSQLFTWSCFCLEILGTYSFFGWITNKSWFNRIEFDELIKVIESINQIDTQTNEKFTLLNYLTNFVFFLCVRTKRLNTTENNSNTLICSLIKFYVWFIYFSTHAEINITSCNMWYVKVFCLDFATNLKCWKQIFTLNTELLN